MDSPSRRAQLAALGVVVLAEGAGWAFVLADVEQVGMSRLVVV
jgi:hypothetical protein